jgi:hypothetical protein
MLYEYCIMQPKLIPFSIKTMRGQSNARPENFHLPCHRRTGSIRFSELARRSPGGTFIPLPSGRFLPELLRVMQEDIAGHRHT